MPNYIIIGADLMEYGPVGPEQVRRWIAEGRVNAETKLQAEGTAEWRALAEVPEFAEASPATASPAAPRFLHTRCEHCSGPIEFPEHGLETQVLCPHCQTSLRLRQGLSPRASGALPLSTDAIPPREFSALRSRTAAESLAVGASEKEYSFTTLYLILGGLFTLVVLCLYWAHVINPIQDLLYILGAAAFIVLFVEALRFDLRKEKKRTEALANLASRFGMQFTKEAPETFLGAFSKVNLFTLGHSRQVRNLMQGEIDGLTVSIFDYTYVTGSGKTRSEHRQTVVGLSLPALALPPFILRPENLFHKVASALGWHDIDFPEAPSFSKRFLLRGAQEHAIRAAFNPGVLDFFERHPGVSAQGCGSQLIYYRAGRQQPPADIRPFLRQGCELARLLAG
jgi:hypothetical protein